jgi:hypothetical protein
LTSEDIVEITVSSTQNPTPEKQKHHNIPNPSELAWTGLRRFISVLNDLDEIVISQALDEIADTLVTSGRAEGTLQIMDELIMLVNARLTRQ